MKSLTYRLAVIFLAISLVPVIIGINAVMSLQTAANALTANDQALKHLTNLLSAAGRSIAESARLQESANSVTGEIANAQEDTYTTLRNMSERLLPKSFAISQIRFSLADATSAERALLLALNMRHIELEELRATRTNQIGNIEQALDAIETASSTYEGLISSPEERSAWGAFQEALTDWRVNHEAFMAEVAGLDALVEDLVRGGPLFASSSRKAYDTIFVAGKASRQACETHIEALNQALSRGSEANVQGALQSQNRSNALIQDLERESEAASFRAAGLSEQIDRARFTSQAASEDAARALAAPSRRFWYLILFSVIGVGGAVVIGIVMSWRISRPIRKMATHLSRIAQGDLTEDVPETDRARGDEVGRLGQAIQEMIVSNRNEIGMANAMAAGDYTSPIALRSEVDQLGRALRTMLDTSNETLHRVSRTVERVTRGAQAVSEASRSLSQGAETSAQAVEEISQTVNHVDRQAQDNAANASEANTLATASRDAARRGYVAVAELVSAMSEIQQAGKKIATVAKLIDDIAFQTNLLALNAAVEAARAGRQGQGFSVVADEVRNLSGRSAKAAKETSDMVQAMLQRMDAGVALAVRSDSEFQEIVEATTRVAQIFEDISAASTAQSRAMAQIAQGLNQIDDVIQENTHNASRTAASAQALSHQADELRQMVSRFRLVSGPARTARNAGGKDEAFAALEGRSPNPLMLSGGDAEHDVPRA